MQQKFLPCRMSMEHSSVLHLSLQNRLSQLSEPVTMHTAPRLNVFTLANIITALRILVAPIFSFLLVQDDLWCYVWALVLFVAAALTDFVDGVLARRFGEISEIGIFLDPLADKILVLSALFGFVMLDLVPLWMVAIVVVRDIVATVLRVWSWSEGKTLRPTRTAKWKTFAQMGFVSAVLAVVTLASWTETTLSRRAREVIESGAIEIAMGLLAALTLVSLIGYLRRTDQ